MRPYIKWTTTGSIIVLLLGLGWTYRLALLEWFAPERATLEEHTHEKDGIAYWTCPMHPSVQAGESGPCPICAMDLQPVPAAEPPASVTQSTTQPTSQSTSGVPGFITLTPWQQQLIGVMTAPVERRPLRATIRTVGRVDYDETRLADVNLKIKGWIEKLYVNYTGKSVVRGQPLFTLYSPELVSTQEEYLLVFQTLQELETQARQTLAASMDRSKQTEAISREAITRQHSTLEATRQRLLLWDLDEAQIRALEEQGKSQRTVTIYAPASGIVTDKMAVQGMYVEPGMRLYRIAALDTVWVYADIYEHELPFVREGQQATTSLSYVPGQTFQGTVDYVYPYLDSKTRTAKVRLRVPNARMSLRPDMYADVVLQIEGGEQLCVPEDAVLFSGRRRLVFIDMGQGRFQPREVRLGARMGNYYHILEGLKEGEQVVTSAHFLLDSESKLKNVMGGMASQYEQ